MGSIYNSVVIITPWTQGNAVKEVSNTLYLVATLVKDISIYFY